MLGPRTSRGTEAGRWRNETTGDIEHGGTMMLVNSRGRVEWRIDGGWDRVGELLRRLR